MEPGTKAIEYGDSLSGAERELYAEDIGSGNGFWETARGTGRKTLMQLGKKTGFLPYNKTTAYFVRPYDLIQEPEQYIGYPELGRKYYHKVAPYLQEFYAGAKGIVPALGKNIKAFVIDKLLTYFVREFEKVKEGLYRIRQYIIKISGAFDTKSRTLYMDETYVFSSS